ncbi:MAG: enoyl-CoA hydratase/isomerase family protein [Actinomycetota bacterium]|nr:enoyl-CoA hydratase/isomerase family protein [Actinomycetota bacterium]
MILERAGAGVDIVRLDRPDKRNALDSPTLAEFVAVLDDVAADPDLRVLVISTTNARAFCAGADISEQLDRAGGVARMALFCRMYSTIEAFPVPTIAVCVGDCVGAGAEIIAGCDLRVGGDNLKLAWAGARLGVPVGPARLPPLIGVSRAKELVFTGRVLTMPEAEHLGLLHRTSSANQAEAVARDLAAAIAAQSPTGVRVIKQMFRELDATSARVSYENELLMDFQEHGGGLPTG